MPLTVKLIHASVQNFFWVATRLSLIVLSQWDAGYPLYPCHERIKLRLSKAFEFSNQRPLNSFRGYPIDKDFQ
jgi:hypothetical protein